MIYKENKIPIILPVRTYYLTRNVGLSSGRVLRRSERRVVETFA